MINPLKLIPSWRGRLIVGVVVVIIVGASLVGYRLWYNSLRFVSTDNAKVTVDLIQVGSVNAGRIIQMNVDVDTPVTEGQVIAVVDIPSVISRSDTTDTAKLGFRDVREPVCRGGGAQGRRCRGSLGQCWRYRAAGPAHRNSDGPEKGMGRSQHQRGGNWISSPRPVSRGARR